MSDFQETTPAPSLDEAQASNAGIEIPGEAPEASEVSPETNDTESRARAQGWVPKEEFRGDPAKWRDANEFIRVGEQELPVLRERNRDLTRKLSEFEQRSKDELARIERMGTIALQRQRDDLIGRYEAAMRDAVNNADLQRYDQLKADRYQAVNEFDRSVNEQINPQPRQPPQQQSVPPEVVDWANKNQSIMNDPVLNMQLQAEHVRILAETPGLSLTENLNQAKAAVASRFPHKFGIQPRQGAGAVEGSTPRLSAGMTGQKGASSLPPDARRVGERYVKDGYFKDINEYAKEYFAQ